MWLSKDNADIIAVIALEALRPYVGQNSYQEQETKFKNLIRYSAKSLKSYKSCNSKESKESKPGTRNEIKKFITIFCQISEILQT